MLSSQVVTVSSDPSSEYWDQVGDQMGHCRHNTLHYGDHWHCLGHVSTTANCRISIESSTGNTDNLRKYLQWFAVCTFCCVNFYFYPRCSSGVSLYYAVMDIRSIICLESAPHLQSCNYIFNPTTQEQFTMGSMDQCYVQHIYICELTS